MDGVNVYHARLITAGKALAKSYPVEADLVVGVPDSGLVAAMGYSEESGHPVRNGLPQEQLRGKNVYQAKPKRQRVQREDQAECHTGGGKRQKDHHGG